MSQQFLFFCRPGYERECEEECQQIFNSDCSYTFPECGGLVIVKPSRFRLNLANPQVSVSKLVFSRQILIDVVKVDLTGSEDRVTPIMNVLEQGTFLKDRLYNRYSIEHTDSQDGKKLAQFCKKLSKAFENGLKRCGFKQVFSRNDLGQIHLVFTSFDEVYIGYSHPRVSSHNTGGILRLKIPQNAPSRSFLKIDEAMHTFFSKEQKEEVLLHSESVCDLGAAPGGWSYYFVSQNMRVFAIDNGPMDEQLMQTGLVNHIREDAFHFVPPRKVKWMVCDIVEQPQKVAQLISKWFQNNWCDHCITNLKLPMKKRFQELQKLKNLLQTTAPVHVQMKQLYHDRNEVTCYIRRI